MVHRTTWLQFNYNVQYSQHHTLQIYQATDCTSPTLHKTRHMHEFKTWTSKYTNAHMQQQYNQFTITTSEIKLGTSHIYKKQTHNNYDHTQHNTISHSQPDQLISFILKYTHPRTASTTQQPLYILLLLSALHLTITTHIIIHIVYKHDIIIICNVMSPPASYFSHHHNHNYQHHYNNTNDSTYNLTTIQLQCLTSTVPHTANLPNHRLYVPPHPTQNKTHAQV